VCALHLGTHIHVDIIHIIWESVLDIQVVPKRYIHIIIRNINLVYTSFWDTCILLILMGSIILLSKPKGYIGQILTSIKFVSLGLWYKIESTYVQCTLGDKHGETQRGTHIMRLFHALHARHIYRWMLIAVLRILLLPAVLKIELYSTRNTKNVK
jgi:hypothetical protein